MKNGIIFLKNRILTSKNSYDLAKASAIGVFLGMQPITGIRTLVAMILCILFQWNIAAVFLGILLTIMFPFLNVISLWIGDILGMGYKHFYFFNIRMLFVTNLLKSTPREHYFIMLTLIGGALCGLISLPIFKIFYNSTIGIKKSNSVKDYIFYDSTGKKRSVLVKVCMSLGTFFGIVLLVYGVSININPYLPKLGLKESKVLSHISYYSVGNHKKISQKMRKKLGFDEGSYQDIYTNNMQKQSDSTQIGTRQSQSKAKKMYAFYVDWDENSLLSLKEHIKDINVVVPDWYTIDSNLNIKNLADKKEFANMDKYLRKNHVADMPLINNYIKNNWDSETLSKLINSPQLSNQFIQNLVEDLIKHHYYGVNVDFESLKSTDTAAYNTFIQNLSIALKQKKLKLSLDVPADDTTYDNKTLSNYADAMMVMMYDEHEENSDAGAVASQGWYEDTLSKVLLQIPANKVIVSLGSYGYDWNLSSKDPADDMTFGDCMDLVHKNKLKVVWDSDTGNPYITYKDSGDKHVIWLLDAATFYNELTFANSQQVSGAALWRLGSEDMSLWHVVNTYLKGKLTSNGIKKIDNPVAADFIGKGEILKVIAGEKLGKRKMTMNTDKMITSEVYQTYPTPYEIDCYGKPKTKEIALTFDDGPDPVYTPQILDILKKNHVKATFFVVGVCGEKNPDLVEREYKQGEEIGNHTYTHPFVASKSEEETKFEMNATQRLIQEITGHSTILFRPPYVADAMPSTPDEISPVLRAEKEGYLMIGESIDTSDWQRPPYQVIVKRVLSQLNQGNIILMHDAGGNRENTVKALPIIIKDLKQRGYKFVQVHDLLHVKKSALMPAVESVDNPFLSYDTTMYDIMYLWGNLIQIIFYAAIVIGIFRLLFLIYFSGKQKRKSKKIQKDENFKPFVSIVIAAYNEEKVIVKTIQSILESTYQNFEILVVNDGSTDHTSLVLKEAFLNEKRVRVIDKENGGKALAINVGFRESLGEYVVCMDADTVVSNTAIEYLILHFKEENIAAVSGNIRVGNKHNLFTLWQHVEYVTGFNLERRAFASLNAITVVPGAIGAWKRKAVEEVGYFQVDTLAEDTDITLSLLEKGYSIVFEEQAYAYTEAPSDLKSLVKQRYRWAFGTLQCLYKHRDSLFQKKHKALGYLALPNMWLFQYVFQTISPLADIYFVIGLLGKSPLKIFLFYIVFLIIDYLAALYAFHLEKLSPKPLIGLIIQRIIYRQIMAFVVIRSMISALAGVAVGWNKLIRRGNVKMD